jgi:glycosyltransferase involved in cell wall biosynthesis
MLTLGQEVLVVAPRHPSHLPAREVVEGVDVERVDFRAPRRAPLPLAGFPVEFAHQFSALSRIARGGRPDIVNVHCASVQLPVIAVWCRLHRIPLVVSTHGETVMDAANLYGESVYMRAVLRWTASRCAALTACSTWTATQTARLAPAYAGATVVPNGIDADQWRVTPLPNDPVLCMWGRHVPQKGFDLALSAFAVLRADIPAARLLIGGAGPETDRLRRDAGPGVHFLGLLDRDGVQRLLDESRVAVVPSRFEPFGIVALEAMATGRGVVWSSIGGLDEATGGLGRGVDPANVAALAAAMRAGLERPEEPGRVRRHAERSPWSAVAETYLDLYAGTVRGGRGG